jgi:subtilisin family serine protease
MMMFKPSLLLRAVAIATGMSGFAVGAMAAAGDDGKPTPKNNTYIVEMSEMPVTAYKGGIKGYAATKPSAGKKIDPDSPAVVNYMGYLAGRQNAALASVGGKKVYNYGYVFSGFAADLTPAQAAKLAQTPGVRSVVKDEARELVTSTTPDFLGLSGADGFWANKAKGENVIIGIVDSGVWPEHPSFSDRTGANGNASKEGKLAYQQIAGWHGRCIPGEAFSATDCNRKLIGARYYNAGFGGNAAIDADLPHEFNSPRDHNGHGSHTASTAGGNARVQATGAAAAFGMISGIAPRARIAVYKSCWSVPGTAGSCFGTDSIAAIDQAVADGVDVINYSISGSRTNFRDPVEIAFLFAADAGVFVATSAGNSGPTVGTVAHPGPWVTTVAAGTHNRNGEGSVTLGNGATYAGASYATPIGPLPLIDSSVAGVSADPGDPYLPLSASYPVSPAFADRIRLCYPGHLDSAKAAGRIVVCDRGTNALVDKGQSVKDAGGAGMVIVNVPGGATTTLAILHAVPAVHVQAAYRDPIKAYAATAGATASIGSATIVLNAAAPLTASFSSRGPLQASGSLLKPDIIAPGQDILAAVAPPNNNGKLFDLYSGTSMSSPHVAGLAALFKELYPRWSPMAIKSALMTTAGNVLDGPDTNPLVIFRQGAGHVRPNLAANPGLVFDSGFNDWLNFICGTQPGSFCSAFTPINPSDLNVASIAIGAVAGVQTVTRKVTNVGGNPATYTPSYTGMVGFNVTVSPATLTIAAGETKPFTVSFTRTAATLNAYTGGQLTLSDGTHSVRVPMVVRPVALAAPAEVGGSYSVTFGYDGAFTATARGLIPAALTSGTVLDDPTNGDCSLTAPNARLVPVTIPAGTTYARFSLFDADVNAGADIDLCVFNSAGTFVGGSGTGTSAEEVNLLNPAADTYTVVVHGWGVVGDSPFKLHAWVLGSSAAGNMTVTAPATAVTGQTGAITIATSGLASGIKYLGSVAYDGAAGLPAPTIVRIDQP